MQLSDEGGSRSIFNMIEGIQNIRIPFVELMADFTKADTCSAAYPGIKTTNSKHKTYQFSRAGRVTSRIVKRNHHIASGCLRLFRSV
jgi:hypothetical protein